MLLKREVVGDPSGLHFMAAETALEREVLQLEHREKVGSGQPLLHRPRLPHPNDSRQRQVGVHPRGIEQTVKELSTGRLSGASVTGRRCVLVAQHVHAHMTGLLISHPCLHGCHLMLELRITLVANPACQVSSILSSQ